MKRRVPQPLVIALIALGFLLAGLGGWFLVIGPQRSKASSLDHQIADTNDERALGLMGRTSLPEDAGMIFVYPEPTEGGYWMKNTLIPLSIAFYDVDGTILRILDMEPCRSDPCRVYDPGVRYAGALEVNQGAFERWGVDEGDRLELRES